MKSLKEKEGEEEEKDKEFSITVTALRQVTCPGSFHITCTWKYPYFSF